MSARQPEGVATLLENQFPKSGQSAQSPADTSSSKPKMDLPLIRPVPPRLSAHLEELKSLESSGMFSNYGPVNTLFEQELIDLLFHEGACVTTCNATIALMLAIREVVGDNPSSKRRYALMPSFTFAAAAQAALWCGLTPLLCDIDPHTWLPDDDSEEELLQQHAGEIAVVVPYATFGNNLDLGRYERMSETHDVPIVVDAAASLGSLDEYGRAFGSGFPFPVIFSMHATKVFSVGEGGIIYSADSARVERLRCMGAFGFGQARSATCLGLNAKLTEMAALMASLQLKELPTVIQTRESLVSQYRLELADFTLQRLRGVRQAKAFESILLPGPLASYRDAIIRDLNSQGIGAAKYFSPHLAEQPYIRERSHVGSLEVTNQVASGILSLPLLTSMKTDDVKIISATLCDLLTPFRNR